MVLDLFHANEVDIYVYMYHLSGRNLQVVQ